MKRIFNDIVKLRFLFLAITFTIVGLSLYWMTNVTITNDVSDYLPSDSETLEGLDILEDQFGTISTLKVVFEGLSETEKEEMMDDLNALDNVASVLHEENDDYNVDNHTLFIVTMNYSSTSEEANQLMDDVASNFPEASIGGMIYLDNQPLIPTFMIVMAFIILMIILFLFTYSWIEPFIFLATIGIAILINLGTNIIFDSITSTTFSVAALLQLCLSIDYSIILLNRYRQEKVSGNLNKHEAMKNALYNAFPSITGSAFTTIVGLLCLVFMSFQIGADLGFVLAKGVFISMLSVFFVLPTFVLIFDTVIEKTKKPSLHIGTKHLSKFSFKMRKPIAAIFMLFFIGGFFLRGTTAIGYILPNLSKDKASEIFPDDNTIVLLYDNNDEGNIPVIISDLNNDENTIDVVTYQTTAGMQLDAATLAAYANLPESQVNTILTANGVSTMSIYDFLLYFTAELETPYDAKGLASATGLPEAQITTILAATGETTMTIYDFMTYARTAIDTPLSAIELAANTGLPEAQITPILDTAGVSSMTMLDFLTYARTAIDTPLDAETLALQSGYTEADVVNILTSAGEETMSLYNFLVYIQTNLFGSLTQTELDALNQSITQISQNIAMLDAGITEINQNIAMMDAGITEINQNIVMLDEGIAEIEDNQKMMMEAIAQIEDGIHQLVGDEYSQLIVYTAYPEDSEDTIMFFDNLSTSLNENFSESYYLLGNSAMASEISVDFESEFLMITLFTVVAIFVIVALTFKSITIPIVLVSIIQTAIFITMGVLGLIGDSVYFLAILIVQAILMGATIDYGILFTSYLRQEGTDVKVETALDDAYEGSIHTILTSSSVLFLVTGIISFFTSDATITQVLRALAVGTLSTTLLILFVLPSTLVLIDRFVRKNKFNEKIKNITDRF